MLKTLFKDVLQRTRSGGVQKRRKEISDQLTMALSRKETQPAIALLRDLLKIDPQNVGALTQLGMLLAEVGEAEEAYQKFELAYRLDDSNMEVAVNYASYLSNKQSNAKEAIRLLTRAQLLIPYYPSINSVYAGVQLSLSNADLAKEYSLRGWLADFNNHRMADTYLWYSAYADAPEVRLSSEHHFWANTCAPLPERKTSVSLNITPSANSGRLRIGYWSPDFHDHSVRYFFRPLLEGHDRDRVELILYHDAGSGDAQTEEIRQHCDSFHSVYGKTDDELSEFIRSHKLDVLVELAGHTSHNRLWMLQERLAKTQITALGYPPTTGLHSIDAKCLDPHLFSKGAEKYYSERPMVLPQSFWCFDPREDAPLAAEPPVLANGYVTFGCVGNIGKINNRIIALWSEILRRVPKGRLLLRSIHFLDPMAIESMQGKLRACKVDVNRVTLLGPAGGADFFRSYDHIDIILDTFPFNGGTTTCFAVYMGVPVITLAGESLISRMGASVMENAGGARWVANSEQEYVSKAVQLSQNIAELTSFRKKARSHMQTTSLGNGRKFAREFEDACVDMLAEVQVERADYVSPMPVLDPNELVRRAATVMGHGMQDAASRIVSYCLVHYPDFAPAHILLTDGWTRHGDFLQAANYLLERLESFDEEGRVAALINIVRFKIYCGDKVSLIENVALLQGLEKTDEQERAQTALYAAFVNEREAGRPCAQVVAPHRAIHCIIPCDDIPYYEFFVAHIKNVCVAEEVGHVIFKRCSEALKVLAYKENLDDTSADIVVFLQKNILIWNPGFFGELARALERADVVGYSGAKYWDRLDWRLDSFSRRFAGHMSGTSEKAGFLQVFVAGEGRNQLATGMAVLEGGILAVNAKKASRISFDEELLGADTLLEEYWAYLAGKNGLRLAVHRNLGIQFLGEASMDRANLIAARMLLVERMGFDVFSTVRNDGSFITCPCEDANEGYSVLKQYFIQ